MNPDVATQIEVNINCVTVNNSGDDSAIGICGLFRVAFAHVSLVARLMPQVWHFRRDTFLKFFIAQSIDPSVRAARQQNGGCTGSGSKLSR
jgi:hypothetical protein